VAGPGPIEGARTGIEGGRGNALRTGGGGVEVASPANDAGSTPGGTGSFERLGGGGGSFERDGAGGGELPFAFALPAFAAGLLLRTGGGGGAERPAAGRDAVAFGFLLESPSSAIRGEMSLTRLAKG
jgi:hypothetical protein